MWNLKKKANGQIKQNKKLNPRLIQTESKARAVRDEGPEETSGKGEGEYRQ